MGMVATTDEAGIGLFPTASGKYIKELDGIRAIAVSIVVAAHYRLIPFVPGGFGVTLFFFLSGYLITTLFYSEYQSTGRISPSRFYVRRWLRLTPPLVLSVAVGVALYPITRAGVGGSPVPIATTMAALFYYTNYHDLYWGLDPVKVIPFGICWSLAIEEHFYLIWPWFIRRRVVNARRLCLFVAGLCVCVLIWRTVAHEILQVSTDYTYMATDCRIDSILYGALLRLLFETTWASAVVKLFRTRACRILALVALLMGFAVRDESFRETIRYSIQGAALMPIFTAILCDDPNTLARRVLASRPMVLIGRMSYSIYLFHLLARTPGEVYFGSPYNLGSVISGLLITLAIAYALLILVERPVARLRHRFRADQWSTTQSATAVEPLTNAVAMTLRQEQTGD
jgi:peptidoglycan/LPS O-acetylase OafA/YrhL